MIEFDGCDPFKPHTDMIEIVVGGVIYDLHNASEFRTFLFDAKEKSANLEWEYFDYEAGEAIKRLTITLTEVSEVEIRPRCSDMPYEDDLCLEKILYYEEENRLLFKFWGGMEIYAHCNKVTLVIEPLM